MSTRAATRLTAYACVLAAMSAALVGCGFKGPLVAADPAAPGDQSVATQRVPDAASAAPAAAQDAERVIDQGDADNEKP